MVLPETTVSLITGAVYSAMKLSIEHFGNEDRWKDRKGGVFCMADASTGLIYHVGILGELSTEQIQKCLVVCQEKVRRLAQNPSHISSWQSRNPPERWGGAIRIGNAIFSFSGLPELGDEALLLLAAQKCAAFLSSVTGNTALPVINERLNAIAELSANPYWAPLQRFL